MHRFFGETAAYGLFNSIANIVLYISSICLFKIKMDKTGSFSNLAVSFCNSRSKKLGKVVLFVLASLESKDEIQDLDEFRLLERLSEKYDLQIQNVERRER